eukprot:gene4541-20793_t
MKQSKDSKLQQRKLPKLPTFKSEVKGDFGNFNLIKRRHTHSDLLSLSSGSQRRVCGVTSEIIEIIRAAETEQSHKQVKMDSVRRQANYTEEFSQDNIVIVEGSSQRIAGILDIFQDDQGFWIRKIEITKVPGQGLGFFIKRGNGFDRKNGVFISRVSLGSILDVYGLLHTGDEVLEVNRVNLRGFPLEDVALMMQIPDKLLLTTKSRVPLNTRAKTSAKNGKTKTKNSQKEHRHDKVIKQLSFPDEDTNMNSFGIQNKHILKPLAESLLKPAKFFTINGRIETSIPDSARSLKNSDKSPSSDKRNQPSKQKQAEMVSPLQSSESPDSGIEATPSVDGLRSLPYIPSKSAKSPRKLPTPPPVSERKVSNEVFDNLFESNGFPNSPTSSNQGQAGFKRAELYRVQSNDNGDGVSTSEPMKPALVLETEKEAAQSRALQSSDPRSVKDPRRTLSVSEAPKISNKMGFLRAFSTSSSQKTPKGQRKETKTEPERTYEPYLSDDLNSEMQFTRAFSGMLSVHIDRVTRIRSKSSKSQFYCTIEIDDEFKASTSKTSDYSNQTVCFDEQFDIEMSHASELTMYVFEIGADKHHSLCANGVVFLEKVLSTSGSRSIALTLEGSGVVNISLDFTEAVKYLKRTPSSRKRGVFGFNIVSTLDEERNTIPKIVRKCVDEIEKRGMHIVGIYRVSGNAKKKRLLKAEFDADSGAVDVSADSGIDCNVLSGIIKDYLRELPEPLIPEHVMQLVTNAKMAALSPDMSKRQNILGDVIRKLPYGSRATLIYIMDHLIRVQEQKDINKMDITNLSVCFGPVLMCPASTQAVPDFKKINDALEYLLKIWPKNHERGVEIEITNM